VKVLEVRKRGTTGSAATLQSMAMAVCIDNLHASVLGGAVPGRRSANHTRGSAAQRMYIPTLHEALARIQLLQRSRD
jgi:hypothetical protein